MVRGASRALETRPHSGIWSGGYKLVRGGRNSSTAGRRTRNAFSVTVHPAAPTSPRTGAGPDGRGGSTGLGSAVRAPPSRAAGIMHSTGAGAGITAKALAKPWQSPQSLGKVPRLKTPRPRPNSPDFNRFALQTVVVAHDLGKSLLWILIIVSSSSLPPSLPLLSSALTHRPPLSSHEPHGCASTLRLAPERLWEVDFG